MENFEVYLEKIAEFCTNGEISALREFLCELTIIITTFVDGRYPIPRSEPRAGGLLFYYTKISFNTTIYDVCPIEQGQE